MAISGTCQEHFGLLLTHVSDPASAFSSQKVMPISRYIVAAVVRCSRVLKVSRPTISPITSLLADLYATRPVQFVTSTLLMPRMYSRLANSCPSGPGGRQPIAASWRHTVASGPL